MRGGSAAGLRRLLRSWAARKLRVDETTARLGDGAPHFFRHLDPLGDDSLNVGNYRWTVRGAYSRVRRSGSRSDRGRTPPCVDVLALRSRPRDDGRHGGTSSTAAPARPCSRRDPRAALQHPHRRGLRRLDSKVHPLPPEAPSRFDGSRAGQRLSHLPRDERERCQLDERHRH